MSSLFNTRMAAASLCYLAMTSLCFRSASATSPVTLTPGENIQTVVNANPAGTAFVLTPGFYRGQSIAPKAGDSFTGGSGGVVRLMGSVILKFAASSTAGLWAAPATSINTQHGTCQVTAPLCGYPQDLYIDNQLQTPATTSKNLQAGSWYFDRPNSKVYISTNPGIHTIELCQTPYAFYGSAANVTISNVMVERYANFAQFGAIGGSISGTGWTVSNVEVRYNHGVGVKLGSGSKLLSSFVHDNGELGIALSGTGSEATGNEISFNNFAGFAFAWESGGSKFSNTTNLLLESNNVHDNYGPGLWMDTGNTGAIIENNTVTHNECDGIQHELGYAITIRNNVLSGNGTDPSSWIWNGQISIQNSSNALVYGNTITVPAVNANGIAIINQKRGNAPDGTPYVAENNSVYNNTITYLSDNGGTGQVNDTGSHPVNGNKFYDNKYILMSGTANAEHWWWFGIMDWTNFRAQGEETGGTETIK